MEKNIRYKTVNSTHKVCESLLWRKIRDIRLSAQLAKITDLSGMICGLEIQGQDRDQGEILVGTPWIIRLYGIAVVRPR